MYKRLICACMPLCLLLLTSSCQFSEFISVYILNCGLDNVRIESVSPGTNLHVSPSPICSENDKVFLTALDKTVWVREFTLNRSVGGCLQKISISIPGGPDGVDFEEAEGPLSSTIYLYEEEDNRGVFSFDVKGNFKVKVLPESCS